jgi:uncharacterized membrane protein YcaP (DUF421 family)
MEGPAGVKKAYLEADGNISVIKSKKDDEVQSRKKRI